MRIELALCEQTLLAEIADPGTSRRDVAQTYRLAMASSERVDWRRVNEAIIERWSLHALEWIKTQAHSGRCFDG
jgi:hypothetical protein